MKLIKAIKSQKEKYGTKQNELIRLSNLYGMKVVYMPYGKEGSGYYIDENEQCKFCTTYNHKATGVYFCAKCPFEK